MVFIILWGNRGFIGYWVNVPFPPFPQYPLFNLSYKIIYKPAHAGLYRTCKKVYVNHSLCSHKIAAMVLILLFIYKR
jgi:hypothetical protein